MNKEHTTKQGKQKIYALPEGKKRVFNSDIELYRYCQCRLVARSFCLRGYGIWTLQEELGQNHSLLPIKEEKYDQIMKSIVLDAFRQLQLFLVSECQINITTLQSPQDIEQLCDILAKNHTKLKQTEREDFISLIEICYQLSCVILQQNSMLKLYNSIQALYHQSKARNHLFHLRTNDHQYDEVWDRQIQTQFLHFYSKCQDLNLILQYFKETYQIVQQYFTIPKLRIKLQLFFYYFLKTLRQFCEGDDSGIKLQTFSQESLKILSHFSDAKKIRLHMIDAFFDGMTNKTHLRLIVLMINEYLVQKRSLNSVKKCQYFIPPMVRNMNQRSLHSPEAVTQREEIQGKMDCLQFVNEIQAIDLE